MKKLEPGSFPVLKQFHKNLFSLDSPFFEVLPLSSSDVGYLVRGRLTTSPSPVQTLGRRDHERDTLLSTRLSPHSHRPDLVFLETEVRRLLPRGDHPSRGLSPLTRCTSGNQSDRIQTGHLLLTHPRSPTGWRVGTLVSPRPVFRHRILTYDFLPYWSTVGDPSS